MVSFYIKSIIDSDVLQSDAVMNVPIIVMKYQTILSFFSTGMYLCHDT